MKRASVRQLRYHFSQVEELLREGREIELTKRRRVIARIVPVPVKAKPPKQWPDFLARLKKAYRRKRKKITGAELVARGRDRY